MWILRKSLIWAKRIDPDIPDPYVSNHVLTAQNGHKTC